MQGQRSKAWFKKRHKRWTASTISKLMSDGKNVEKKLAGDRYGEWKYKWGEAAKTALFNKFYQRLTGVMEKETFVSHEMQRGIDLEPLAIERFGELYMQYQCIPSENLVDTGFILFPDDDGTREWEEGYKGENATAGASPDQLLILPRTADEHGVPPDIKSLLSGNAMDKDRRFIHIPNIEEISGIETKVRGEEASQSHAYSAFDENHNDFWQVKCQMHAVGAKKWYYLNFDDEKPAPWDIQVKEVELSEMHIKKMCQKIKDADKIIDGYLKKCAGIETMMPHDANRLLTSIYLEIRNLNEKW